MVHLASDQKRVLDDFVNHTKKLIELGFINAVTDRNLQEHLRCIKHNICRINSLQRVNGRLAKCYDRVTQREYVRYIIKIIRIGLKFARDRPEYFDQILKVQEVVDDYGKMLWKAKNPPKPPPLPQPKKPIFEEPVDDGDDSGYEAIFNALDRMSKRLDVIEHNLKDQTFATTASVKRTRDCLKDFGDGVTEKLKEIQSAKRDRLREHENKKKLEATMRRTNLKTYQIPQKPDDSSSSESEIVVNNQTFIKPQPIKIGKVMKNISIPVYVEDNKKLPKIKPWAYLEENDDGIVRINVHLEFDENVLYNNKLVREVKIENVVRG